MHIFPSRGKLIKAQYFGCPCNPTIECTILLIHEKQPKIIHAAWVACGPCSGARLMRSPPRQAPASRISNRKASREQLYPRLFPSSQRTLEVSVYFRMCPQLFPKSLGIHTPFSLHPSASYQPLRTHSALEVI